MLDTDPWIMLAVLIDDKLTFVFFIVLNSEILGTDLFLQTSFQHHLLICLWCPHRKEAEKRGFTHFAELDKLSKMQKGKEHVGDGDGDGDAGEAASSAAKPRKGVQQKRKRSDA